MTQVSVGRLRMTGPSGEQSDFVVSDEPLLVGRDDSCGIVLPNPGVSRRHARLVVRDGALLIEDLGSLNGVYVNDLRLAANQPFALRDGDRLEIGPYTLVYAAARAAGPPPTLTAAGAAPARHPPPDDPRTVLADRAPTVVVYHGTAVREYPLSGDRLTIGRGGGNMITVDDPTVSREHAVIQRTPDGWQIVDVGSGYGVYQHGQRVTAAPLRHKDSVRIGQDVQLVFLTTAEASAPVGTPQGLDLGNRNAITIGRDAANDLVLDNPQVSRRHARIERRGADLVVTDLGSTNGTYVNGARVSQVVIRDGDTVQIGPFAYTIANGRAQPLSLDGAVRIDAVGVTKVVGRGVTILNNVMLTIKPKEFVAIVGASGSGKSTLLDALCGFRPATGGRVLYNGRDLYESFDAFRTSIGYVPQDDIIHRELTVGRALAYAAELRLPRDTTAAEREQRVAEVINDLGLTERRDTVISRLSGGQRKRVSIGVELLTKPSLFFLDEPTSGLDPATETRMMRLMRELADQGRTLMLITHATQNILLCDKVVFMAKGGRVAFFGTPNEALDFFQVQQFVDIYEKLDRESEPGFYARRYTESLYPALHLGDLAQVAPVDRAVARKAPRQSTKGISRLQQFLILTRRYIDILLSNRKSLAILLLQAPLIAILLGLIYNRSLYSETPLLIPQEQLLAVFYQPDPALWPPTGVPPNCGLTDEQIRRLPAPLQRDELRQTCGNAQYGMVLVFLLSVVAIWLGASNAVKEIVKELPIYRRERMVSLKIVPYLLSKMVVLFALATAQTALLLGIVMAFVAFPIQNALTVVGMFIVTFLTFVAAIMLGLFVSSLVGSNDEAGNLAPVLLIPQFIFAGAVFPLNEMGVFARYIAQVMFSKWSWEALNAIVDIQRIARAQGGPSLDLLDTTRWGTAFTGSPPVNVAVLLGMSVALFVASYVALKRKDSL